MRKRQLPKYGRVLGRGDSYLHDPGKHLYPLMRFLRSGNRVAINDAYRCFKIVLQRVIKSYLRIPVCKPRLYFRINDLFINVCLVYCRLMLQRIIHTLIKRSVCWERILLCFCLGKRNNNNNPKKDYRVFAHKTLDFYVLIQSMYIP